MNYAPMKLREGHSLERSDLFENRTSTKCMGMNFYKRLKPPTERQVSMAMPVGCRAVSLEFRAAANPSLRQSHFEIILHTRAG